MKVHCLTCDSVVTVATHHQVQVSKKGRSSKNNALFSLQRQRGVSSRPIHSFFIIKLGVYPPQNAVCPFLLDHLFLWLFWPCLFLALSLFSLCHQTMLVSLPPPCVDVMILSSPPSFLSWSIALLPRYCI